MKIPYRIANIDRDLKQDMEAFVQNFCKKHGKTIQSIPQRMMHALQQYDWPGNVRELENVVERAVITSPSSTLRLLDDLHADESNGKDRESLLSLEEVERAHIVEVLEKTSWKIEGKAGAAAVLALNPATLRSRMKKLGIKRMESSLHEERNHWFWKQKKRNNGST